MNDKELMERSLKAKKKIAESENLKINLNKLKLEVLIQRPIVCDETTGPKAELYRKLQNLKSKTLLNEQTEISEISNKLRNLKMEIYDLAMPIMMEYQKNNIK